MHIKKLFCDHIGFICLPKEKVVLYYAYHVIRNRMRSQLTIVYVVFRNCFANQSIVSICIHTCSVYARVDNDDLTCDPRIGNKSAAMHIPIHVHRMRFREKPFASSNAKHIHIVRRHFANFAMHDFTTCAHVREISFYQARDAELKEDENMQTALSQ